jgi:hypothetical protein
LGRFRIRCTLLFVLLLLALSAVCLSAQGHPVHQPAQLKVIEIKESDGQILSYRHLAGSAEVRMRGTRLAPDARIKMKIGSRPGFVELDINRGDIVGLKPAHRFGRDFLTYVLWAVSVDGRASNLGEVTFEGEQPVSINVTTPYQTFWLMVTAEPNYAVVDPSPKVMLYSVKQDGANEARALTIRGDLFFFTHYATYDSGPVSGVENAPNQLLQARKAVELASKSSVVAGDHSTGDRMKEEEYTREALNQAKTFLARAEKAYKENPKSEDVVQFAKTAAQSAENARALALGAVGGILVRQLENELANLREELARVKASAEQSAMTASSESAVPAEKTPVLLRPTVWFALVGWGLALVLLFRRRSV